MYKCTDCGRFECDYDDRIKGAPSNCGDCGAEPGKRHDPNCDVQRCSVCHGQRFGDDCKGHKPWKTAWTGYWPGLKEAAAHKVCLNCLHGKSKHMPLR